MGSKERGRGDKGRVLGRVGVGGGVKREGGGIKGEC